VAPMLNKETHEWMVCTVTTVTAGSDTETQCAVTHTQELKAADQQGVENMIQDTFGPCKASFRRFTLEIPASHIVALMEIMAKRLHATPSQIDRISENFTLCAHSAQEKLLAFAKRLLEASQKRHVTTVADAAATDPELAAALANDFDWPGIFGFDVPTCAAPAAAPQTPKDKTKGPPETAATTPAKRQRFRTTGDTAGIPIPPEAPKALKRGEIENDEKAKTPPKRQRFNFGREIAVPPIPPAASDATKPDTPATPAAASSKAATNAAAAQKRLDDACANAGVTADPATAATGNDLPPPQTTPALPSVDRSVFGSMLKRRRFDIRKPETSAKETQSSAKPETTTHPENPDAPQALTAPPTNPPLMQLTRPGIAVTLPTLSPTPKKSKPTSPPPPASPSQPAQPPSLQQLHCGRCDRDGHDDDNCDAFPEAPVTHADARRGALVQHAVDDLEVHYEGNLVVVDGVPFEPGRASGAGCNCLIDTLRQHLGITVNIPDIRQRLQVLFPAGPDKVTRSNFLDFRAHGPTIIRLLTNAARRGSGEAPLDTSLFRIICVDLQYVGHGDIVGDGHVTLHVARVNGNHFIPLREL